MFDDAAGYWAGGEGAAAGVFQCDGEGDPGAFVGGVADEPGVIFLWAAGLGGAGLAGDGDGVELDGSVSRALAIGHHQPHGAPER